MDEKKIKIKKKNRERSPEEKKHLTDKEAKTELYQTPQAPYKEKKNGVQYLKVLTGKKHPPRTLDSQLSVKNEREKRLSWTNKS